LRWKHFAVDEEEVVVSTETAAKDARDANRRQAEIIRPARHDQARRKKVSAATRTAVKKFDDDVFKISIDYLCRSSGRQLQAQDLTDF
jgi:hypothetical protein